MHMCNDLRVVQTTHNVDKDSLQVIWVHEKLLRRDIVPAPEQIDLLTDLLGAAIVYPLEFTHRALYTRQFLQVTDRQAVRLACVYVSGVTGAAPFAAHVRWLSDEVGVTAANNFDWLQRVAVVRGGCDNRRVVQLLRLSLSQSILDVWVRWVDFIFLKRIPVIDIELELWQSC